MEISEFRKKYAISDSRKLLLSYINKRRVVFFLGAGISKNGGIPVANSIIQELFDIIGLVQSDQQKVWKANLPFELIIETVFNIYRNPSFVKAFVSMFKQGNPIWTHQLVSSLASYGVCQEVLTTNFDLYLEKAFIALGKENRVLCPPYSEIPNQDQLNLYKLHGTADDDESIITTMTALANRKVQNGIEDVLKRILSQDNLVIFMGYSFSDTFDIVPIFKRLKSESPVLVVDHIDDLLFKELSINESPRNELFTKGFYLQANTFHIVNEIFREIFKREVINDKWRWDWASYLKLIFNGTSKFQFLSAHYDLLNKANEPKRALEIAEAMLSIADGEREIGMAANRISTISRKQFDFQTSQRACKLSLRSALKLRDVEGIIMNYYSLGNLYARLGPRNIRHFEKSEYYFLRGLDYSTKAKRKDDEFGMWGGLGTIYSYRFQLDRQPKSFHKGVYFFTQAMIMIEADIDIEFDSQAGVCGNFAALLFEGEELYKAYQYASRSLELYKNLGSISGILNALKVLIRTENRRFNYEAAYHFRKDYIKYMEGLEGESRTYYEQLLKVL